MNDVQMGHEKTITAILPALAGANMIFGMGMMELGVTFSFVQLVIDDMLVGNIKKMIKTDLRLEITTDPEWPKCLAEKGFPPKFWSPHMVRGRRFNADEFSATSKKQGIVQEARQKVQAILTHHTPEPLSPYIRQKIKEIILESEERKITRKRGVILD